jgi:hypothetical protein
MHDQIGVQFALNIELHLTCCTSLVLANGS